MRRLPVHTTYAPPHQSSFCLQRFTSLDNRGIFPERRIPPKSPLSRLWNVQIVNKLIRQIRNQRKVRIVSVWRRQVCRWMHGLTRRRCADTLLCSVGCRCCHEQCSWACVLIGKRVEALEGGSDHCGFGSVWKFCVQFNFAAL